MTGYQLRSNLIKDENVNLLADSQIPTILWTELLLLLNVHGIRDVR